jgi:hypothetical protein
LSWPVRSKIKSTAIRAKSIVSGLGVRLDDRDELEDDAGELADDGEEDAEVFVDRAEEEVGVALTVELI